MTITAQASGDHRGPQSPPNPPHALTVMLRVCFAIGGALVIASLFLAAREWRFIATSEHAIARVSQINREWMSGSNRSNGSGTGGNWGYRVIAAFPAADGHMVQVRSPSLTSYTRYQVGDTIGVDYPTGRPDQAQLVRFVDRWMLELVLGGIGAVALAIGGFAVWLLRQPGTRITSNGIGGFSIQSATVAVEGDAPDAASRDASEYVTAPRRADSPIAARGGAGWKWFAVVLLIGVGIGLGVARVTNTGSRADDSARWAGKPSNDAVADGAAPMPGYPSNLTVKPPMMSDGGNGAETPTWTDPANGGATPANLTMAARAFVARPEQDAAMQVALRGQVARLALDCPAITFAIGDTLLLASPAPVFDARGAMQRGLIRQRFTAKGCPGRSAVFNIWVFAPGDGAPVRTVAGFPGTTRADLPLLQDATPVVLGIASRLAPGCRALVVSDTHLPAPPPRDPASPWDEDWLVTGCGKRIALTVRFSPDGSRGMTRIEVPDTMARVLDPR